MNRLVTTHFPIRLNIMPANPLLYHALTFVGRRKENQDSVLSVELPDREVYFFAVADGMGGYKGGSLASRLIVEAIEQVVRNSFDQQNKAVALQSVLSEIFEKAQQAVREGAAQNPELTGMGSTLTCLLIHQNRYVWGNVGDSRIYKISNGAIAAITEDHSAINDFAKKSGEAVTEELIRMYGNIITRSIDGGTDRPDIFPISADFQLLQPNEGFILCSDGLLPMKSSHIDEHLLKTTLNFPDHPRTACEQMISFAFQEGSTDNISAVFITNRLKRSGRISRLLPYPPVDKPVKPLKPLKALALPPFMSRIKPVYLLLFAVLVITMVIAVLLFNQNDSQPGGTGQSSKSLPGSTTRMARPPAPFSRVFDFSSPVSKSDWHGFIDLKLTGAGRDSLVLMPIGPTQNIYWKEFPKDSPIDQYLLIIGDWKTNKMIDTLMVPRNECKYPVDSLAKYRTTGLKQIPELRVMLHAVAGNQVYIPATDRVLLVKITGL